MAKRKKRIPHSVDDADIKANASGRPELESFALRFNSLLEYLGIDQQALANDTGLSSGAISAYRNGQTEPKLSAIIKIASYLNVDCHFLMTGVHPRNITASKDTGLSDMAIDILSERTASGGKYAERFIDTVNFLLEQEEPPPTSPGAYFSDVNEELAAFDAEYCKWTNKKLVPLLSDIDAFLNFKGSAGTKYDLMEAGQILNVPKPGRFNIGSLRTVDASAVIERVLLSDIEDDLKQLRNKYQNKK